MLPEHGKKLGFIWLRVAFLLLYIYNEVYLIQVKQIFIYQTFSNSVYVRFHEESKYSYTITQLHLIILWTSQSVVSLNQPETSGILALRHLPLRHGCGTSD